MRVESIEEIEPRYDVLIFNAHPDDVEMAAGGTLLKLIRSGKKVLNVVYTRGEAGRHGTMEDRVREMGEAAAFGGYDYLFLDRPDCGLFFDELNRNAAVRCLRRARPSLTLAPYHTNHQGYRDGINHEDHLALGRIVTAAVKVARASNYLPGEEPHVVDRTLYYMVPRYSLPTLIVDVSEEREGIERLIGCFASQTNITRSGRPILEALLDWRRLLGYTVGIELGEGFLSEEPLIFDDPGGLCERVM